MYIYIVAIKEMERINIWLIYIIQNTAFMAGFQLVMIISHL